MSFALVLKKTSWYRRRYSRPLRVKLRVAMIQCILSSSWTGYMLIKVRHDLPEVGFVKVPCDDKGSVRMRPRWRPSDLATKRPRWRRAQQTQRLLSLPTERCFRDFCLVSRNVFVHIRLVYLSLSAHTVVSFCSMSAEPHF